MKPNVNVINFDETLSEFSLKMAKQSEKPLAVENL